jgi:hypothetical protein
MTNPWIHRLTLPILCPTGCRLHVLPLQLHGDLHCRPSQAHAPAMERIPCRQVAGGLQQLDLYMPHARDHSVISSIPNCRQVAGVAGALQQLDLYMLRSLQSPNDLGVQSCARLLEPQAAAYGQLNWPLYTVKFASCNVGIHNSRWSEHK